MPKLRAFLLFQSPALRHMHAGRKKGQPMRFVFEHDDGSSVSVEAAGCYDDACIHVAAGDRTGDSAWLTLTADEARDLAAALESASEEVDRRDRDILKGA